MCVVAESESHVNEENSSMLSLLEAFSLFKLSSFQWISCNEIAMVT